MLLLFTSVAPFLGPTRKILGARNDAGEGVASNRRAGIVRGYKHSVAGESAADGKMIPLRRFLVRFRRLPAQREPDLTACRGAVSFSRK